MKVKTSLKLSEPLAKGDDLDFGQNTSCKFLKQPGSLSSVHAVTLDCHNKK